MSLDRDMPFVLRFRDLGGTALGETLRSHGQIIASQGHVWWGWWKKGGEKVPLDHFADIQPTLRRAAKDILLLDTANETLHRARCTDIEWGKAGTPIPSPDADSTPAYYRNQKFEAWFRLDMIDDGAVPPGELQNYSYFRVDDFFVDGRSKYDRFYGKRVFDVRELIQQNRTIWFLRPAAQDDPQHRIELTDARSLTPEHFPRDFISSSRNALLWLSDLHFSDDTRRHAYTSTAATSDLATAVKQALDGSEVGIGGLLVSGDVTWSASRSEFEQAEKAVVRIADNFDLQRYQTIVCPGNHDLAFSNDPGVRDKPVEFIGPESRAEFAKFYSRLYYLQPNEHLACGRRFLLAGTIPIEIAALNSSALTQKKDFFQGHGFVGQPQLDAVARGMGWTQKSRLHGFRIVMLHHHVVPVSHREEPREGWTYSVVLDAGAILRWLVDNDVRLVLHGHMHQPARAKLALPVRDTNAKNRWHEVSIVGLGSTGVARDHLGAVGQNTFGLLEFGAHSVTVRIRTVHPTASSEELWAVEVPYASPGS